MLTLTPLLGVVLAFLITFALTPFVRRLGVSASRIDERRDERAIPRLGGLAIACGLYVPVLGLMLRSNWFSHRLYEQPRRLWALLGGGAVILLLGVYDDLRGASAWKKLAVQIPVAALAWWAGARIGGTAGPSGEMFVFPVGLSAMVTVGWIVLVMNALNLIDGLDGLASGVALQALAVTALCAWHREEPVLALIALCLAGSVGGFLVHNFHPATIFMGDSGSLFLGYVLGVASVWSSQKSATAVGIVLPMLILALPLLDTTLAITRRLLARRPVFDGDTDHMHHRVLAIGGTHGRSVMILYGTSLFFNLLSVALVFVQDRRIQWGIVGVAIAAALGVARALGYPRTSPPVRARVEEPEALN